jgi:hypothetical protein
MSTVRGSAKKRPSGSSKRDLEKCKKRTREIPAGEFTRRIREILVQEVQEGC